MGVVSPNKDTYFVCPRCGTIYRYIAEPAVELPRQPGVSGAGGGGSCSPGRSCCEMHAYAPTCDSCGTGMLVTNSEDVVVFLRDALRRIWEGEAV